MDAKRYRLLFYFLFLVVKVRDEKLIGGVFASSFIRDKRFESDIVPAANMNVMIGLQGNVKMSQNMKKRPCKIFTIV